MDPNGGMNPPQPRLDNTLPPQPPQPQPMGDVTQPVSQQFPSPPSLGSIPSEAPASDPMMPTSPDPFGAPQPPQFSDPMASFQQPIDPDPMLNQPMAAPMSGGSSGGIKKILMFVLIALLGLAVLGGIAYGAYTQGIKKGKQDAAAEFQLGQAAQQEAANPEEAAEDIQLELAEKVASNQVKEETLDGAIKEQINASDGFSLYVTDVERNFSPNDTSYKLNEGDELVKVNFIIGNREDKAKDVSSSTFKLEDSAGTKITPESRLTDYDGSFESVKIESGSQTKQSIVFAVKKDDIPLKFVREQKYRVTNPSTSQSKEVTTKITVTVAK